MTPTDYKKKMEKQLIKDFQESFYEKIGYRPTVITERSITNEGLIVLTLNELEEYFIPYLPMILGKKHNLGSKDRTRELVELRCIFFFIGRSMHYGLKAMGTYLGGRDHTTVIHNIDVFKNLYETDPRFRQKYLHIINQIKKDYEPPTVDDTDKAQDQSQSDILSGLLQGEDSAIE
jgi:hypothetical protein